MAAQLAPERRALKIHSLKKVSEDLQRSCSRNGRYRRLNDTQVDDQLGHQRQAARKLRQSSTSSSRNQRSQKSRPMSDLAWAKADKWKKSGPCSGKIGSESFLLFHQLRVIAFMQPRLRFLDEHQTKAGKMLRLCSSLCAKPWVVSRTLPFASDKSIKGKVVE